MNTIEIRVSETTNAPDATDERGCIELQLLVDGIKTTAFAGSGIEPCALAAAATQTGEFYIGTCGCGDLFILPKWHNVFPERMLNPGAKLSYLIGGKKCNYLLTNRPLGELPCATRQDLAGWNLYTNTAPHEDCNPNRELDRLIAQRKEIVQKLIGDSPA